MHGLSVCLGYQLVLPMTTNYQTLPLTPANNWGILPHVTKVPWSIKLQCGWYWTSCQGSCLKVSFHYCQPKIKTSLYHQWWFIIISKSFTLLFVPFAVQDVDGIWGEWEAWSGCSVQFSCQRGGVRKRWTLIVKPSSSAKIMFCRTRLRSCDNPAPQGSGAACEDETGSSMISNSNFLLKLPQCTGLGGHWDAEHCQGEGEGGLGDCGSD